MANTTKEQIDSLTLQSRLAFIRGNSLYGMIPIINEERKKALEDQIKEFHRLKGEINELCKKSEV